MVTAEVTLASVPMVQLTRAPSDPERPKLSSLTSALARPGSVLCVSTVVTSS